RQLKQHALAFAFERLGRARAGRKEAGERPTPTEEVFRFSPADGSREIRDACLKRYTLSAVYTRDLVAAHQDEVICLGGLAIPDLLEAGVLGSLGRVEDLLPRLEEAGSLAGQTVAVEGLEHVLARSLPSGSRRVSRQRFDQAAHRCATLLALGLRLTQRRAVVNLNAPPPSWA